MMNHRPFTLVEVLISMTVLSIFMLGLLQFYNMSQSTMSLAADRTELFERARVAMDMMSNDIACIYYSQDDKEKHEVSFKKNSDSSFSVSTLRPEKLLKSNGKYPVTNILGVKYEWDESNRIINYSSDQDRDTFNINEASFGKKTELIEGVTQFKVTPNFSDSYCSYLPAYVDIQMELIDKTTARRLANSSSSGQQKAILDNAPKRTFQRRVVIDRGQRKTSH